MGINSQALRADIGQFLRNYGSLANPLSSIFAGRDSYSKAPGSVLRLSNKDDVNFALWNALGTLSWVVPSVGLGAYLANKLRHDKLKKAIQKNTLAHINADYPVLSPEGDLSITQNITKRPVKELEEIREAVKSLPKVAAGEGGGGTEGDIFSSAVVRTLPLLSVPLATILTAHAVNSKLKEKYAEELEEENRKIQNLQDAVDIRTLENLNYIRKRRNKVQSTPVKTLADRNTADVMSKLKGEPLKKEASTSLWEMVKAMGLNIPAAALLLLAGGGTIYGTHHFLKKQDEMKKLKFLEDRALGRNRTLKGPELLVELPSGYEENIEKRKQEQIIPGIEEAEIVENPKKDEFLG